MPRLIAALLFCLAVTPGVTIMFSANAYADATDDLFVEVLCDNAHLCGYDVDSMVDVAQLVCHDFRNTAGYDFPAAIRDVGAGNPIWSDNQVASFIGGAVAMYCPDQEHQFKRTAV